MSWARTGGPIEVRADFSATLLADGRVLVVGGVRPDQGDVPLATAEIYDPATGAWQATGRMHVARWRHTATLLSDGRVLVAGGERFGSAELFDPRTLAWTATDNLDAQHSGHGAVLLVDGRVLVAGGDSPASELFDPVSGRWQTGGRMVEIRDGLGLARLADGRVLAFGGCSYGAEAPDPSAALPYECTIAASSEIYDPAKSAWTATGAMTTPRAVFTTTLLGDGRLLVVGGVASSAGPSLATAEAFDPGTGTWSSVASLRSPRDGQAAVRLRDGRVMVIGGVNTAEGGDSSAADPAVEILDPATGSWTAGPPPLDAQDATMAILLEDGRVLIVGNGSDDGVPAGAEILTP